MHFVFFFKKKNQHSEHFDEANKREWIQETGKSWRAGSFDHREQKQTNKHHEKPCEEFKLVQNDDKLNESYVANAYDRGVFKRSSRDRVGKRLRPQARR